MSEVSGGGLHFEVAGFFKTVHKLVLGFDVYHLPLPFPNLLTPHGVVQKLKPEIF